jgi:hypothetical protein
MYIALEQCGFKELFPVKKITLGWDIYILNDILNLSVPGRKFKLPVTITEEKGRLFLQYPFCREFNEEIKQMESYKYHGFDPSPRKVWSVAKSPRNIFTLRYMSGENVFARYDSDVPALNLDEYQGAYPHQGEFSSFILTRKRCIIAGEMGTGKTLAAIIAMEKSGHSDWWWVGTKASLKAVEYEFRKWKAKVTPRFLSYDSLKGIVEQWQSGKKAPRGIVFDESSR